MPKSKRLTAEEGEAILLKAGFEMVRSKGSHRIYIKEKIRIIIPFHKGNILHPKAVKEIFKCIKGE